MINFKFTLPSHEAKDFLKVLQEYKSNLMNIRLDYVCKLQDAKKDNDSDLISNHQSYITWYDGRIKYMDEIFSKIKDSMSIDEAN